MSYHDVNLHLTLQSEVIHVHAADDGGSRISDAGRLDVTMADVRRLAEALALDAARARDFQPVEPREARQDVEEILQELGARLSKALLPTRVSNRCAAIHGPAVHPREALRLRLQVDLSGEDARLHAIPWECVLDPQKQSPLALNREFSLVRLVERPGDDEPPDRPEELTILAVAPRVEGLAPLAAEAELEQLRGAVGDRGVKVEELSPPTLEALERRLRGNDVHVVHFLGHGDLDAASGEGRVFFQTADGAARPVTGRELSWALQGCRSLRLLFLNACRTAEIALEAPFAGVATAAIENAGLPAVLAMQFPIRDSAAVGFAEEVYRCLAQGDGLDRAVAFGRRQLRLSAPGIGVSSWMVPVLFSRLEDGRLFRGEEGRGWAAAEGPVGGAVVPPAPVSDSRGRRRRALLGRAASLAALGALTAGWIWAGGGLPELGLGNEPPTSRREPGEVSHGGSEADGAATAGSTPEEIRSAGGSDAREDGASPAGTGGGGGGAPVPIPPPPVDKTPSRARVQILTEDAPVFFEGFDAVLSAVFQRDYGSGFWTLKLDIPGEDVPPVAVLGPEVARFETSKGRLELPVVAVRNQDRQLLIRGLRTATR